MTWTGNRKIMQNSPKAHSKRPSPKRSSKLKGLNDSNPGICIHESDQKTATAKHDRVLVTAILCRVIRKPVKLVAI